MLSFVMGVRNPICKSWILGENRKLDKNEQFSLVEQKVLEMLEEGAIQKVVPIQGKFLSNFFLTEKKGWREPLSDKFLKSQQNGTSALSQILSRTGQFAMQDRSQRGIFFSSTQHKVR